MTLLPARKDPIPLVLMPLVTWIADLPLGRNVAFVRMMLGMVAQTHCFVHVQPVAFRVVAEQLSVAAPIQRGLKLTLGLILWKVLIENVAEEFQRKFMVRLSLKCVTDLVDQRDVL